MRVRSLYIAAHESPGTLGPLVRSVVAHVTTPDHVRTQLCERADETRWLGVVDDNDVPFLHPAVDRLEVPGRRALVDSMLPLPERASIAGRAVETVVDSLRHREVLRISGDHQPVRLESDAAHVAE